MLTPPLSGTMLTVELYHLQTSLRQQFKLGMKRLPIRLTGVFWSLDRNLTVMGAAIFVYSLRVVTPT